ncbi:M28 family metallopeptidase [Flammeovirga sp. OC4]|uniref:M28 family metallopeptidase n=1 Tax=Flammeovirga sp. OC4 TaxID=1382345 RepID=UPI0005C4B7A6|nr:M20/M25/M40 family metallo-hydrolase [Flammeovirga sp. OC4]
MRIIQTIRGLVFILLIGFYQVTTAQTINRATQIIDTLSSDALRGRQAGSEGEKLATDYISNEFKKLGLKPAGDNGTYFQVMTKFQKVVQKNNLSINKEDLTKDQFFIDTNAEQLYSKKVKELQIKDVPSGKTLKEFRQELLDESAITIVWVKTKEQRKELISMQFKGRNKKYWEDVSSKHAIIWVIPPLSVKTKFKKILLDFKQDVKKAEMRNVMAKLEGSSKPNEVVMVGAHHDHIGILDAVQGDSIANGADDNASGVSAVLQIAEYFAKRRRAYARTILFTTFSAEEIGLVGSKYMADKMSEEELKNIVAMINIEMIGKPSANGKRKAYITGYNKSNLGRLMQKNVRNARLKFGFFADPYPDLKLFMRSDNAPFAAKGVPAHTFSSTDIDFDSYYHTVNDEMNSLDFQNIVEVTKGIIVGIEPIVSGRETPSRIR